MAQPDLILSSVLSMQPAWRIKSSLAWQKIHHTNVGMNQVITYTEQETERDSANEIHALVHRTFPAGCPQAQKYWYAQVMSLQKETALFLVYGENNLYYLVDYTSRISFMWHNMENIITFSRN